MHNQYPHVEVKLPVVADVEFITEVDTKAPVLIIPIVLINCK